MWNQSFRRGKWTCNSISCELRDGPSLDCGTYQDKSQRRKQTEQAAQAQRNESPGGKQSATVSGAAFSSLESPQAECAKKASENQRQGMRNAKPQPEPRNRTLPELGTKNAEPHRAGRENRCQKQSEECRQQHQGRGHDKVGNAQAPIDGHAPHRTIVALFLESATLTLVTRSHHWNEPV